MTVRTGWSRRVALLAFFFCQFLCFNVAARDFPDVPEDQIEVLTVRTQDNVALRLTHLRNENGPLILLMPGFEAKDLSLELLAEAFHQAGFDTFIANWRGSNVICKDDICDMSVLSAKDNRFQELYRYDLMANWRSILEKYSTPAQRDLGMMYLGHSMGGMLMAAALSDPQLAPEIKQHLKGFMPFLSPRKLKYVPISIKLAARAALPLLYMLKNAGIRSINLPAQILSLGKTIKQNGGLRGKYLLPMAEIAILALIKYFINPAHTEHRDFRRTVFKKGAEALPVDLAITMVQGVLDPEGALRDENGEEFIKAEAIDGIPVLLSRAQDDTLAPWRDQAEYFDALATHRKQMLDILGHNHVTTLMVRGHAFGYFKHLLAFAQDPEKALLAGERLESDLLCETFLTRAHAKLRNLLPYPFGLR